MLAEKAFHFLSSDNLPFTVFNDQTLAVIFGSNFACSYLVKSLQYTTCQVEVNLILLTEHKSSSLHRLMKKWLLVPTYDLSQNTCGYLHMRKRSSYQHEKDYNFFVTWYKIFKNKINLYIYFWENFVEYRYIFKH